MLKHEETNVNDLVRELMSHLEEKGYTKSTRTRLQAYYQVLIKYAKKRSIKEFSLEMGKKFLMEHHGHSWEDYGRLSASQNHLQRHITHFEQLVKILNRIDEKMFSNPSTITFFL